MARIYGFPRLLWQTEPCRWLITVVLAAFVGIAAGKTVLGFSGSVSVVDGSSMEPTYSPGARVYTAHIFDTLERGDVVLVDDGNEEYALKRIVGLPGETVQFWRGYVFINCRMLREPYLPKYTYTFPDEWSKRGRITLGQDEYFVLGDNRTRSVDSRSYGPVERKRIKSRVPVLEGSARPRLVDYTLPARGKRTIQPVSAS